MGRCKIPSVKKLLKRKRIYDRRRDPVWVYLEREMKLMDERGVKPYNHSVGNWLTFMRDLKYFLYCDQKRKEKRVWKGVGPAWYFEYSPAQIRLLKKFPFILRKAEIDQSPIEVQASLREIGITLKLCNDKILDAVKSAQSDPGLFFWDLFTLHYGHPPSVKRTTYKLNAKLMMSGIVFSDIEECIREMEKLTKCTTPPIPEKERVVKKYMEPKIRLGSYLQRMYVPIYTEKPLKEPVPCPLPFKIKIQTDELNERRVRQIEQVAPPKKPCDYPFWVPPIIFPKNGSDPEANMYAVKLKMYKTIATPRYLKLLPSLPNEVVQVANISFSGGKAVYMLNSVSYIPTGFIIYNGGKVRFGSEYVTQICGFYWYPKPTREKCDETCDCLDRWDELVMRQIKERVCKCSHRYDFYNSGKRIEKYVHPPTKYAPFWFDHAKIYQFFPRRLLSTDGNLEDFINDKVHWAFTKDCRSQSTGSLNTIAEPKSWEYVRAFLADLSKTPLLIPHLPEAYFLNSLCAWARQRVHGKISMNLHRQMLLHTQRAWLTLGHVDFRTRAYRIPFTEKEMKYVSFFHRPLISELSRRLYNNFKTRTGKKQVKRTQMWLGTMRHDYYPSSHFTEIFFSYLPCRIYDVAVRNPYKKAAFSVFGSTCPLANELDNM